MRIGRHFNSLRFRIVLAITSLALFSAIIYSIFSWFIFEISDDRLFNWHALTINKLAVEEQKIPENSFNSFSFVGSESNLVKELAARYSITLGKTASLTLSDVFHMANISDYPDGHRTFDMEYEEGLVELQIVASPWHKNNLYVIYDVTGFETAEDSTTLFSDNFVLIVLIPLALALASLAALLSMGLTKTILKPLTKLSRQVTSTDLRQLSNPLADHYYPDEVGELANTFNHFLNRIEKYVENEKRFSREVSHELRTPTTSLTIALELMETTRLDDKQKVLLDRMKRANKDTTQLISTFIWLAKNAPEKAPTEKVFLYSSVDRVLDTLDYLSQNKTIEIVNNIDQSQMIDVNPSLLEIVLNNLIRNALQYTQKGKVEISAGKDSLTITDTGLGIPEEEIENIEKAFYSLQPDGIGLGMSIVQRVMNKLGWQLVIKSKEQNGTEVTVTFC